MAKLMNAVWIISLCSLFSSLGAQNAHVTLFADCYYQGTSRTLGIGNYRTRDLGIGNDILSSFRVSGNLKVTVYKDDNFQGESLTFTYNEGCLSGGWNDAVSSIRVEWRDGSSGQSGGGVTLYEDCDYKGSSHSLGVGDFNTYDLGIGNDVLSSIRVPRGFRVTLFKDGNFQGARTTLTADNRCFSSGWNDVVSSIRVESTGGGWNNNNGGGGITLYADCNYRGSSHTLGLGYHNTNDLGIGNDVLSSVRIPPGFRVTFYKDGSFEGASMTLTADDACFPDSWNDVVSSILVERGSGGGSNLEVTLYKDCEFRGSSAKLRVGEYSDYDVLGIGNDALSSLKVPNGLRVIIYKDANFRGEYRTITSDVRCMSDHWNDSVTSIKVERVGGKKW